MKRIAALLLALLLLAGLGACVKRSPLSTLPQGSRSAEGTQLEVIALQAGKADAFLLTTPNSTVLIDCGERGFGQTILDRLAALDIQRVDVLIVTHFDQDHVGGAAKLINNIAVGCILENGVRKDSTETEKYLNAVENAGLEPVTVQKTLRFTLDGVGYTVEPPAADSYTEDRSNNSSLVVTVENGQDVLLFMGDAQTQRIAELLENGSLPDCDLLKVAHHGGEEPLLPELLAAVQPELAVITSSDDEPEAESTLAALAAAGAETFLTRRGEVRIHSGGAGVTAEYGA